MNKKRILLSLSGIVAVAVAVTLSTGAFFSNTETSSGNVFTAGSVDLKVDHLYSSYNGQPCELNCEEVGESLILNGGFEVPEVTSGDGWQLFADGTAGLDWDVQWVNPEVDAPNPALQEYQENVSGWDAHGGDQYAELDSDYGFDSNERALVKISQTIATDPGTTYRVRFWFSPRPGTGNGENSLTLNWDGAPVATVSDSGTGDANTTWTEYFYDITATDASTVVEFVGGGTNNTMGVFLDDVSVKAMNCEYVQQGGSCSLWQEKDLEQGDHFWDFSDVKPGDYGTNLISLHPYTNESHACLFTHNLDDQENSLLTLETDAGDTGSPVGELSPLLKLFAWEDDGDGIFQDTENVLVPENTPIDTEIIALTLSASNTTNVGVAWCAGVQDVTGSVISCDGSGDHNIAQTDSVTLDFTAYAVQTRHNEQFSCDDVVSEYRNEQ